MPRRLLVTPAARIRKAVDQEGEPKWSPTVVNGEDRITWYGKVVLLRAGLRLGGIHDASGDSDVALPVEAGEAVATKAAVAELFTSMARF